MASTTIAFYGIRLEPSEDELDSLQDRDHPAILCARKAGLQHYWGNFGSPDEQYYLFVGRLLGKFGVEDARETHLSDEQFSSIAAEVSTKLITAGFSELPRLFFQFQPDG